MNALMAIPNLIALVLLSPIVIQLTREYFVSGGKPPADMVKQED
jgi:AGCS family alanine or glycine:cation symporter